MWDDAIVVGAVGAILGGVLGLSGTLLSLRHQRSLARLTWQRDRLADAVGEVLAATNAFSRTVGDQSWTFDGRFVEFANAMDRALMYAQDDALKGELRKLEKAAHRAHQWRHGNRDLPIDSSVFLPQRRLLSPETGTYDSADAERTAT